MQDKRLNVQQVAEILVSEIGKIEHYTKRIEKVISDAHTAEIKVDVHAFREQNRILKENIEEGIEQLHKTAQRGRVISNWEWWIILSIPAISLITCIYCLIFTNSIETRAYQAGYNAAKIEMTKQTSINSNEISSKI